MHVVYMRDNETARQAKERYCKETGSFIEADDVVLLVIYDDPLNLDG